jgi:hypothetical protein
MAQMRSRIEQLIATEPTKRWRFAFTEVYFSGSAVNKVRNDVMFRLAERYPECQFRGFWVRESLGFETRGGIAAGTGRPALVPDPRAPANLVEESFPVPFAVGDDAARLIERGTREPIYIFDSEGRIVDVLEPGPGEDTRDLVVRILGERGGP